MWGHDSWAEEMRSVRGVVVAVLRMCVGCHKHTYVQCIYEQYMYVRIYIRMYVCTYGRNWMGGGLGLGCNWHMSLIYCMGPLCLF